MTWRKYSDYTESVDTVRPALQDAFANHEIMRARAGANDSNRLILNGDFAIDQPNVGAAVTVSAATVYGCDGVVGIATGAGAFSMQTFATGGPQLATGCVPSYLRLKTTTADASLAGADRYRVQMRIEGLRWKRLGSGASGALQATLSIFMRTSRSGGAQIPCAIQNSAGDRSYPALLTISAQNTWERPKLTFLGDASGTWLADTGVGAKLIISLGAASTYFGTANAWAAGDYDGATGAAAYVISTLNETLDITGVDILPGEVEAGLYVPPDPTLELLRCMREYEKSFLRGTAPAQNVGVGTGEFRMQAITAGASILRGFVKFTTPKRNASSAVTFFNPSAANAQARDISLGGDCSSSTPAVISDAMFIMSATGNASSSVANTMGVHWVADNRL